MIRNVLTLILLITVSGCVQASDKKEDRPLTIQEFDKSWRLFVTIKHAGSNDSNLAKQVSELLQKGARPNIWYEKYDGKYVSALSLAQQKNMPKIVALLKNEDPLQPVWDEMLERGYIKPEKSDRQRPNRDKQTVAAKGFLALQTQWRASDGKNKKTKSKL